MSNSSSSSSINFPQLNQALNRYGPMPLLFFGTIGNVFNLLVFTRKIFRNNSCVIFFLASAVSDSFLLAAGVLARTLNGFGNDLSQYSSIFCKLRFFTTYYSGYSAAWFMSFACIERYLGSSASVHQRQLVTIKRAYLCIVFILLLGFAAFGQHFYCVDINQHLLGGPQSCYALQQSVVCQVVDSVTQLLFWLLAPTFMMIIFGSLIVRNVRRKRLRVDATQINNSINTVIPLAVVNRHFGQSHTQNREAGTMQKSTTVERNAAARKRDMQLATMLLTQVKNCHEKFIIERSLSYTVDRFLRYIIVPHQCLQILYHCHDVQLEIDAAKVHRDDRFHQQRVNFIFPELHELLHIHVIGRCVPQRANENTSFSINHTMTVIAYLHPTHLH